VSLGIVKNHGGLLEVHSEPGRGTTMTVQLPLTSVRAHAPLLALDEGRVDGRRVRGLV
jgi:chemotaxis protein histidine kinase CheA